MEFNGAQNTTTGLFTVTHLINSGYIQWFKMKSGILEGNNWQKLRRRKKIVSKQIWIIITKFLEIFASSKDTNIFNQKMDMRIFPEC